MLSKEQLQAEELKQSIDMYIETLSEKHRMHRKIKFLLDVRGLVVINKMGGDYVEFGVYRGEMMYAAAKVLSPHVTRFIGLDTFSGLPKPRTGDDKLFVFEKWGFMAARKSMVEEVMSEFATSLIEGDFREESSARAFNDLAPSISILSVDCNWPSSVEAAFELSAPFIKSGTIVFIDDYFVATRFPNFNDPILDRCAASHDFKLVEFMTYPPSARAFLVEKKNDA